MPSKDLYYQKYLKYKSKYINLQSQIGGVKKLNDEEFAKLFTNQPPDIQDEIYKKIYEIPISRTLNRTRRDSVDIKTFTSLKEKLRLNQSIEKEDMFISVPIIVYHPDYLNNNEILMLAKIFIQNSNKPNMRPLINYMTLSPDSNPIQLVNAANLPLNFNLTKLKKCIFDTKGDNEFKFNGVNYDYQYEQNYLNDNQLHFELFFIFICILITNKQIKLKFTSINLNVYKKSFNTIIFGLKQNIITHLIIIKCNIDDEEATLLATALKNNTTLTELTIYENNMGNKGATALATIIEKDTVLLIIYFDLNQIGDEGAKALATALEKNRTLERLSLYNNIIGDEGAKAIAKALNINTTLNTITLGGNKIGDDGAIELASALDKNKTLFHIELRDNKIDIKGAIALVNALTTNTNLKHLYHLISDLKKIILNKIIKLKEPDFKITKY